MELYDVLIKFQCVQDLLFLRIINSKQSEPALSQLISISLFLEGEGGWELAEQ